MKKIALKTIGLLLLLAPQVSQAQDGCLSAFNKILVVLKAQTHEVRITQQMYRDTVDKGSIACLEATGTRQRNNQATKADSDYVQGIDLCEKETEPKMESLEITNCKFDQIKIYIWMRAIEELREEQNIPTPAGK